MVLWKFIIIRLFNLHFDVHFKVCQKEQKSSYGCLAKVGFEIVSFLIVIKNVSRFCFREAFVSTSKHTEIFCDGIVKQRILTLRWQ